MLGTLCSDVFTGEEVSLLGEGFHHGIIIEGRDEASCHSGQVGLVHVVRQLRHLGEDGRDKLIPRVASLADSNLVRDKHHFLQRIVEQARQVHRIAIVFQTAGNGDAL